MAVSNALPTSTSSAPSEIREVAKFAPVKANALGVTAGDVAVTGAAAAGCVVVFGLDPPEVVTGRKVASEVIDAPIVNSPSDAVTRHR